MNEILTKPIMTKDDLYRFYITENQKLKYIAQYYSCSQSYISRQLKKYGLQKVTLDKYLFKTFYMLTPIEYIGRNKNRALVFKCKCMCGNTSNVVGHQLKSGKTKSCGCLRSPNQEPCFRKKYQDIPGSYLAATKKRAETRNLEYTIKPEDMWNQYIKQNRLCALTKIPLTFAKSRQNRKLGTASLDRIDSNRGYTPDNIQWIHKDINRMKSDFTQEYYIDMCKLVAQAS